MTECPQGCLDGFYGRETMKLVEREQPLDVPELVEVPTAGGVKEILRTHYLERFLECRVCDWVIDL